MEGFAADGGNVSLSVFLHQLQAFSSMLSQADQLFSSGKRAMQARVVDLTHSSPATVTVELTPRKNSPDVGGDISALIRKVPEIHASPELFGDRDRAFLEAVKELSAPVGRLLPFSVIVVGDTEIQLSQDLRNQIGSVLSGEETALGSIDGRLEAINIHDDANVFFVYPVIGSKRVKCFFADSLKLRAISCIDKNVVVTGTTRYRAGDPFPFEIEAEELTQHPDDSALPKMHDLYAIAPDLTGGVPSEVYVRQVRNGWR
jgi:hypothetical protein